MAIVVGWLARKTLHTAPWVEQRAVEAGPALALLPIQVGLGVFLAVASALFVLFISAYSMRMNALDWRSLPVPRLLWLNTGVLVVSSIALQWSSVAARRNDTEDVKVGLLVGGASAVIFLAGQLLAWQQLTAAGYLVASNPANSFFYLLTAVHGLHLTGGLVALGRTSAKVWRSTAIADMRLSVELCAIYWHFLLLVWLVLLGLLTGWTDDFVNICRQLLS